MVKLPFEELFEIYGKDLPSKREFFQNRVLKVTYLQLETYYNVGILKAWDEFARDYELVAKELSKPKKKDKEDDDTE